MSAWCSIIGSRSAPNRTERVTVPCHLYCKYDAFHATDDSRFLQIGRCLRIALGLPLQLYRERWTLFQNSFLFVIKGKNLPVTYKRRSQQKMLQVLQSCTTRDGQVGMWILRVSTRPRPMYIIKISSLGIQTFFFGQEKYKRQTALESDMSERIVKSFKLFAFGATSNSGRCAKSCWLKWNADDRLGLETGFIPIEIQLTLISMRHLALPLHIVSMIASDALVQPADEVRPFVLLFVEQMNWKKSFRISDHWGRVAFRSMFRRHPARIRLHVY